MHRLWKPLKQQTLPEWEQVEEWIVAAFQAPIPTKVVSIAKETGNKRKIKIKSILEKSTAWWERMRFSALKRGTLGTNADVCIYLANSLHGITMISNRSFYIVSYVRDITAPHSSSSCFTRSLSVKKGHLPSSTVLHWSNTNGHRQDKSLASIILKRLLQTKILGCFPSGQGRENIDRA